MVKAIQFHSTGGPEVLQWEEVTVGDPGPGEIRVKHTAIGLNYIDTYHRTGLYPLPLPHAVCCCIPPRKYFPKFHERLSHVR